MIFTSGGRTGSGARRSAEELLDVGRPSRAGLERDARRLDVVRVDALLVVGLPVHPDRGDQDERVDFARPGWCRRRRPRDAARDAGLGGAPGELGMAVAADVSLVHEERRRLHRQARLRATTKEA